MYDHEKNRITVWAQKMEKVHSAVRDDMEYVHKQLVDNLDRLSEDSYALSQRIYLNRLSRGY